MWLALVVDFARLPTSTSRSTTCAQREQANGNRNDEEREQLRPSLLKPNQPRASATEVTGTRHSRWTSAAHIRTGCNGQVVEIDAPPGVTVEGENYTMHLLVAQSMRTIRLG